jgi:hypothetical protein
MALYSDRPLRRTLVKLACQIFLGRSRAHYHAWLPSLSIDGRAHGNPGVVRFGGQPVLDLLGADALSSRAGTYILIVGSGPSVKGQDFSGLPQRSAILLNGAISLIGKEIGEPLAVAVEDERFIWRHFAMVRERLAKDTLCLFSPGVLNAICDLDKDWLTGRPVILIDSIRKPYGMPRRTEDALRRFGFVTLVGEAGFSADPDCGVFQGGSVAISALQFALGTRAGRIGFLGVDISNAKAPRFYEASGDTAFSGIAGAEKRILAHIALAKTAAEKRDIVLVNHSPVSALKSIGLDYQPFASAAL